MSQPRSMNWTDWKDVLIRAVKTFVQVFVSSVPVSALMSLDWTIWKAAALAAGSSAVAIVWNAILNWSRDTD